MAILLPEATQTSTESLTPRQIVAELDKYVIGQTAAKRAVAIALRNRMRRQKLAPDCARRRRGRRARSAAADARSLPRTAARRTARLARRRSGRAREIVPVARDHRGVFGRRGRHQPERHAAGALPGEDEETADEN